jgi:hypothetical protein
MGNYVQPDFRIPSAPGVTVQVEGHNNPMGVVWPLPRYVENLSDKDDPQHTARNGKSGKGGPG